MTMFKKLISLFTRKNQIETNVPADSRTSPPVIRFPSESPSLHDSGVLFPATVNGRRVGCIVTYEVLQDIFHCTDGRYMDAFTKHRPEIEAVATKVIKADPKQQPPYVIRLKDFPAN